MEEEKKAFKAGMVATMKYMANKFGVQCPLWRTDDQVLLDMWYKDYERYG